jgi:endonuclease/exonuclease/phosphatase family metal-dependent hydrolase
VLGILTINLLLGQASPEAVTGLAQRTGADVLFVQELTSAAAAGLDRAGIDGQLPHRIAETRDGSGGSGIYARFPLADGLALASFMMAQPAARLKLPDGQQIDLVCIHLGAPAPPYLRERAARWRRELGMVPPPGDPPRVIAGDFNATADHASFRRLLSRGHADAAIQTGNGLVPTWGPGGRLGVLTVDHVLVDRRCAVLATSIHRVPGTDHRAVYARIRLPACTASHRQP